MGDEKYHEDETQGHKRHGDKPVVPGLYPQVEDGEPGAVKHDTGNGRQHQHLDDDVGGVLVHPLDDALRPEHRLGPAAAEPSGAGTTRSAVSCSRPD